MTIGIRAQFVFMMKQQIVLWHRRWKNLWDKTNNVSIEAILGKTCSVSLGKISVQGLAKFGCLNS